MILALNVFNIVFINILLFFVVWRFIYVNTEAVFDLIFVKIQKQNSLFLLLHPLHTWNQDYELFLPLVSTIY